MGARGRGGPGGDGARPRGGRVERHSLALSDEGRLYSWGGAEHGKLGGGASGPLPRRGGAPYQPEPRTVHALREYESSRARRAECHSVAICTTRPPAGRPCWSSKRSPPHALAHAAFAAFAVSARRRAASRAPRPSHRASPRTSSRGASHRAGGSGSAAARHSLSMCRHACLCSTGCASSTSRKRGSRPHPRRDRVDVLRVGRGASHGRLGVGREEEWPRADDGVPYVDRPHLLRGLAGYRVARVAASAHHSLACTSDGQLLVWGTASYGRLGFEEGALRMARDDGDGAAYQLLPRQLWVQAPPPARVRAR